MQSDGSSALHHFTPSLPTATGFSRVLLPIGPTAISTFFSRIPHSLVAASPHGSTSASSQRYFQKAAGESLRTPALLPALFSTAKAFIWMPRKALSAGVHTSAGLPCTRNSALNEAPNPLAGNLKIPAPPPPYMRVRVRRCQTPAASVLIAPALGQPAPQIGSAVNLLDFR